MKRSRPSAFVLAVLTAVFICMPTAYASGEQYSSPVISSACGRISGRSYNGGVCYLGIPYGKATAGTFVFACYILSSYDGSSFEKTVNMSGSGNVIPIIAASALCYIVTVAVATEIAVLRSRKRDVITTLKEIAYT